MSTILFDENGAQVIVKDAGRVAGMLKQGFTVEPPECLPSEPVDVLDGDSAFDFVGTDNADALDVDLNIAINDEDLG